MNITVYLGANEGNDPALHKAVTELGAWIGQSGNTLVYGGSKSGLMGALADSVLNAGGRAIGVEPQFFVEKELQHDGLTQLIVTKDGMSMLWQMCRLRPEIRNTGLPCLQLPMQRKIRELIKMRNWISWKSSSARNLTPTNVPSLQ